MKKDTLYFFIKKEGGKNKNRIQFKRLTGIAFWHSLWIFPFYSNRKGKDPRLPY